MRINLSNKFVYCVICFAVLLAISQITSVNGVSIPKFASVDNFLDGTSGLNDPGSFASMAKDIYYYGHLSEQNHWLLNLWPPGFVMLEAGILKVFGIGAPLPFILQVLACFSFSLMMVLQRALLVRYVGLVGASVLPFALFIPPVSIQFLLGPTGVIFGETFSVSALFSAFFLVLLATERQRLALAVAGGLSLAVAAYFRSQYELIVLALTGLAVPLVGWCIYRALRSVGTEERAHQMMIVRVILVALITAHAAMMPWRLRNYRAGFGLSWVQTADIVAKNSLSTHQYLVEQGGSFVIAGGGDLACKFEPSYCGHHEKRLFYKAFFHNIGKWYAEKISLLPTFWFPFLSNYGVGSSRLMLIDEAFSALELVLLLALVPLLYITRKDRRSTLTTWTTISMLGSFLVIFTFAHFETRYFFLVKLFAATQAMMLGAAAIEPFRVRFSKGSVDYPPLATS